MTIPRQTATVVSCNTIPKDRLDDTVFEVIVRIGDGQPFRMRSRNGFPLKLRHFSGATTPLKTVAWVEALLAPGSEITAIFEVIPAKWQTAADGFIQGDRMVDPTQICSKNEQTARSLAPPLRLSLSATG